MQGYPAVSAMSHVHGGDSTILNPTLDYGLPTMKEKVNKINITWTNKNGQYKQVKHKHINNEVRNTVRYKTENIAVEGWVDVMVIHSLL